MRKQRKKSGLMETAVRETAVKAKAEMRVDYMSHDCTPTRIFETFLISLLICRVFVGALLLRYAIMSFSFHVSFCASFPLFSRIGHHPRPCSVTCSLSESSDVQLLHLGTEYAAFSKPPNLLVHPTSLSQHPQPSLLPLASSLLVPFFSKPPSLFPVHRLDRPTSGVILLALHSSENASLIQKALSNISTVKHYWTLCYGLIPPTCWKNEHALIDLDGKNRKKRSACTEFERLGGWHVEGDEGVWVVRATLKTGRRHQVRRHLSNERWPVLGDTSHGKGRINRLARKDWAVERCCLHARRLAFQQPDGEWIEIQAPVPQDLRNVVEALGGSNALEDGKLDLG